MKPNEKLTCERAQSVLEKSDAALPGKFTVDMVCRYGDTYVARWVNEEQAEKNADSVSDPDDPDTAKRAYRKKDVRGFTEIWFNQGEDGKESIAVETVSAKTLGGMVKASGEGLRVVDRRNPADPNLPKEATGAEKPF